MGRGCWDFLSSERALRKNGLKRTTVEHCSTTLKKSAQKNVLAVVACFADAMAQQHLRRIHNNPQQAPHAKGQKNKRRGNIQLDLTLLVH